MADASPFGWVSDLAQALSGAPANERSAHYSRASRRERERRLTLCHRGSLRAPRTRGRDTRERRASCVVRRLLLRRLPNLHLWMRRAAYLSRSHGRSVDSGQEL